MKKTALSYTALSYIGIGFAALGLSACGGSDDNNAQNINAVQAGVLGTNPVEGVRWVSGEASGTTDALGSFEFRAGEEVSFYIGDILIGTAIGNELIIPADFVANSDNTNPTVVNIIRFLSSLDNDNDPSNGITITEQAASLAAGETIDFTQTIDAFQDSGNVQTIIANLTSVTSAGSRSLLLTEAALNYTADTSVRAALNASETQAVSSTESTSTVEAVSSIENTSTVETVSSTENTSTVGAVGAVTGIDPTSQRLCVSNLPRLACDLLNTSESLASATFYGASQTCSSLGLPTFEQYTDAEASLLVAAASAADADTNVLITDIPEAGSADLERGICVTEYR